MSQSATRSSLANLKRLAYQSESITNAIGEELHRQDQQIDRILNKTDDIHDVAVKNTKMSRQIYSFWYYLKDKVMGMSSSNKNQDQKNEVSLANGEGEVSSLGSEEKKNDLIIGNHNSTSIEVGEKVEAQDEALDEVLNMMKSVKKNQKNLGQAIERQQPKIEKIGENMDKINKQISDTNYLLHKKLKK